MTSSFPCSFPGGSGIEQALKEYRKHIFVSHYLEQVRPFPKVRDLLLRMKLGLPAKDVLALGDTPYDAEAAGKAGIWTVGVTTGGWSAKEVLFAGCIEVYRDVEDLLSNFEGSAFCR